LIIGDGQTFHFTFVPANACPGESLKSQSGLNGCLIVCSALALTESLDENSLVIRIQPDEGITLKFDSKVPGQQTRIRSVNMDFRYGASFGVQLAEAYERLLLDCILGDSTLYARRDMTERGWEIVTPILEEWESTKPDFSNYEAGTWGPKASDELLARDGNRWRRL